MQHNLTVFQKGLILVSVPLVLEIIFIAVLAFLLRSTEIQLEHEARAKETVAEANNIIQSYYDAISALTMFALTHQDVALERYHRQIEAMNARTKLLRRLVAGNPAAEKRLTELQESGQQARQMLEKFRESIEEGGRSLSMVRTAQLRNEIQSLLKLVMGRVQAFVEEAASVERDAPQKVAESKQLVGIFLAVGIVANIALALIMALFFSRGITGRLLVLYDNAVRFGKGLGLMPRISGTDEIARVDEVFHDMAEEISRAQRSLELSEARVRSVVESVPVGLITMTPDGMIQSLNPAACEMFGCSDSQLVNTPVAALFTEVLEEDFPVFIPLLEDKLANQETELEAVGRNGRRFPVDVKLTETSYNDASGLLLTVVDVTEKRRIEEMKQQFVAMVSHDLRSPLSSQRVFFQCLQDGVYGALTDDGVRQVESALRGNVRLMNLINDLLDVDKLEAGMFDLNFGPISLRTMLDKSVESIAHLANQSSIKVIVPDTDITILADQEQLIRVVVNLLSNAVKFSPNGGEVRISIAREEDLWVRVNVSDQGPGIHPEYQATIFERFKQVPDGDQTQKSGSGLGLTIAKAIVEAHGGTIGVVSAEGRGSTFWFKVKAAEPDPNRRSA